MSMSRCQIENWLTVFHRCYQHFIFFIWLYKANLLRFGDLIIILILSFNRFWKKATQSSFKFVFLVLINGLFALFVLSVTKVSISIALFISNGNGGKRVHFLFLLKCSCLKLESQFLPPFCRFYLIWNQNFYYTLTVLPFFSCKSANEMN